MNSKWLSNQGSIDRVKSLLEQAGLPLELSVEKICEDFCSSKSSIEELLLTSEKLVYATHDNPGDYREIDRVVSIYEEFPVSELNGIQLKVNVPIECKYRRDLEVFAFPLGGGSPYRRFPLHSILSGSQYFASLLDAFSFFAKIPFCDIRFLEIKGGESPQKVYEENLAYNAAGALYDFILTEATNDGQGKIEFESEFIEETNLVTEFSEYIEKTHFPWEFVVNKWIFDVSKEQCDMFNAKYFEGKCVYHYIGSHLPVICLNAPIYLTTWTNASGIEKFEEVPYCMSSIRKHGWPGLASSGLLSMNPEVPVIITNSTNLERVLELGCDWHKELHMRLASVPVEITDRWALESSLSSAISSELGKQESQMAYRSDFDFGP
jgi:hypothetical protein